MPDLRLPDKRDWSSPALSAYQGACLFQPDATLADVAEHSRSQLTYLASPFTKAARNDAGKYDFHKGRMCSLRAGYWSRRLLLHGVTAISPIIQAVEMLDAGSGSSQLDPLDGEFWEAWCRPLLIASPVVIVPPIPGWQESEGVWTEVRYALQSQRRVFLVKPSEELRVVR